MSIHLSDEYVTVRGESAGELKVEGSRFLSLATHVESVEDVDRILTARREHYHDATHTCFAYRLRAGRDAHRFSDDGEPAGTAGKPILVAIDRENLTDTLVAVTRYFGGVKLGTGGLARAYGEAARLAVAAAKKETRFITRMMRVVVPHVAVGAVLNTLGRHRARIVQSEFDVDARIDFEIRASLAETVIAELRERTGGKASFQ